MSFGSVSIDGVECGYLNGPVTYQRAEEPDFVRGLEAVRGQIFQALTIPPAALTLSQLTKPFIDASARWFLAAEKMRSFLEAILGKPSFRLELRGHRPNRRPRPRPAWIQSIPPSRFRKRVVRAWKKTLPPRPLVKHTVVLPNVVLEDVTDKGFTLRGVPGDL